MNDLIIAKLDSARRLLSEAKTLQETKSVVDIAAAAEVYAKRQQLGEDAIGYAHEIKIYALRKLGEMIKAGKESGQIQAPHRPDKCSQAEQLSDIGISRKTSALAQKLSGLEADQVSSIAKRDQSITQVLRKETAERIRCEVSLPNAKYRVIYADPPWNYGDNLVQGYGASKNHYPAMSIGEVCALEIATICESNCVLFLWVPSPILEESFQVINAWGFTYKTSFVWDKVKHNMGHYNSVRHEFLLIATRGSAIPDTPKLFDSVVTQERGMHSEKPEIFYDIIETLYPSGKKLELFSRKARDGWESYGFEAVKEGVSTPLSIESTMASS